MIGILKISPPPPLNFFPIKVKSDLRFNLSLDVKSCFWKRLDEKFRNILLTACLVGFVGSQKKPERRLSKWFLNCILVQLSNIENYLIRLRFLINILVHQAGNIGFEVL